MKRDRDEAGSRQLMALRANFAASRIAILKCSRSIGGDACSREATPIASAMNFALNGCLKIPG
eukprot:8933182-Pyramimonas_sp.AAC.1